MALREPPSKHQWEIEWRNDVQGFIKTTRVDAVGIHQAITFGSDELRRKGYDPSRFAVTYAHRRQPIYTEASDV